MGTVTIYRLKECSEKSFYYLPQAETLQMKAGKMYIHKRLREEYGVLREHVKAY